MQLHNPTNQSRLCPSLGENLEAYEVREVPAGFQRCEECRCVVGGEGVVALTPEAPSEPVATVGEPEVVA